MFGHSAFFFVGDVVNTLDFAARTLHHDRHGAAAQGERRRWKRCRQSFTTFVAEWKFSTSVSSGVQALKSSSRLTKLLRLFFSFVGHISFALCMPSVVVSHEFLVYTVHSQINELIWMFFVFSETGHGFGYRSNRGMWNWPFFLTHPTTRVVEPDKSLVPSV